MLCKFAVLLLSCLVALNVEAVLNKYKGGLRGKGIVGGGVIVVGGGIVGGGRLPGGGHHRGGGLVGGGGLVVGGEGLIGDDGMIGNRRGRCLTTCPFGFFSCGHCGGMSRCCAALGMEYD